jgi:hypothetical protein
MNTKIHIDYIGYEVISYYCPISRKPHARLAVCVMLVPFLAYSSSLKMEAARVFENWFTFDDYTMLYPTRQNPSDVYLLVSRLFNEALLLQKLFVF